MKNFGSGKKSWRKRERDIIIYRLTNRGVKAGVELANFPKLPVDALESEKLSG